MISLPVNDDWVRGRLVSVATAFFLTATAEWADKETEKRRKKVSVGETNKLNKASHHLSGPSTSSGPDYCASQSAKIQQHTKEA